MEVLFGLLLVILAGLGTGTAAWPIKKIKHLHFEQYLLVLMFTGIILYPWLVVLFSIPDPVEIVSKVGLQTLLISNLLSVCWGIANVLYLICAVRIGAALTGSILSATGMSVGVIIPMIFKGSGMFNNAPGLFSPAGLVIMAGLVVIIIGIVLVSLAGFGREKVLQERDGLLRSSRGSGSFLQGLILVILAGFLSSGLSLSFVYGQGTVIEAAKSQGAGDIIANVTVWAYCILGGGLVNVFYALFLMAKHNSWKRLFERKDELIYGSIIGLQYFGAIILFGRGILLLGVLGASVGFAIQQSFQVIGNQLVGFIGGEWKDIYGKPRKNLYLAFGIILLAVVLLAFSNTI